MKFLTLSLLTAFAAAAPVIQIVPKRELEVRQSSDTENDLDNGDARACPKVILIFARGTFEPGNMGTLTGPPLANALEGVYGASNIWLQGVGGPYDADAASNYLPGGTSPAAIGEAVRLFNEANTKCPNTPVVAGGYSQGSAVIAGAIPGLSATVRAQVKGIVVFGYTENQQNSGGIPSYPSQDLDVFCAVGDLVCDGTLDITAAHLSYGPDAAGPAPQFLEKVLVGN